MFFTIKLCTHAKLNCLKIILLPQKWLFWGYLRWWQIKQCSMLKQRSVIKFLVAEKCKPCEIYGRMYGTYGEAYFNLKNDNKWAKLFKENPNSIQDEDKSSWPKTVHLKWRIQLICSFWLREELQQGIFLNNWEFLWVQYMKLCMMTLPFLRSFVVGFVKCWYQNIYIRAKTVETISQFCWEHLSQIALSDFHWGIKFSSKGEVKSTLSEWLKTQSKDFHAERMQKFVFQCEKRI